MKRAAKRLRDPRFALAWMTLCDGLVVIRTRGLYEVFPPSIGGDEWHMLCAIHSHDANSTVTAVETAFMAASLLGGDQERAVWDVLVSTPGVPTHFKKRAPHPRKQAWWTKSSDIAHGLTATGRTPVSQPDIQNIRGVPTIVDGHHRVAAARRSNP